jgi:hypothetical protein
MGLTDEAVRTCKLSRLAKSVPLLLEHSERRHTLAEWECLKPNLGRSWVRLVRLHKNELTSRCVGRYIVTAGLRNRRHYAFHRPLFPRKDGSATSDMLRRYG